MTGRKNKMSNLNEEERVEMLEEEVENLKSLVSTLVGIIKPMGIGVEQLWEGVYPNACGNGSIDFREMVECL